MTRIKRFSSGPEPTTERGKRRHANREPQRQQHAKRVWEGGYTIQRIYDEVIVTGGRK